MATATKKAVEATTKTERRALLEAEQQVLFTEMRDDAGVGHETVGHDDLALPFIKLLQSNSPEVSRRDPGYVSGAEAGMFLNTVTEELHDGEVGLIFVPCYYSKTFIEWVPRQQGGGFVKEHATREAALTDADPANEIVDTANHYVLAKTADDDWQQALVAMTSTKLRASRRLNSLVMIKVMGEGTTRFTPPRFSYKYLLTSIETENDKGRFFVPRVGDVGPVDSMDLYQRGKAFYQLCKAGEVKVDFNRMQETGDGATAGGDVDDDVPF